MNGQTQPNHSQADVHDWVRRTFGEGALNDRERALRLVEEALELGQALGLTVDDVEATAKHVFARPVGHAPSECGGVVIMLEVLAEHLNCDLQLQANAEWHRINSLPQSHFDAATRRKEAAGLVGHD